MPNPIGFFKKKQRKTIQNPEDSDNISQKFFQSESLEAKVKTAGFKPGLACESDKKMFSKTLDW